MNARMTFSMGALAAALVLATAPGAEAGGVVYWGDAPTISTGTPVVSVPSRAAHVAGRAYETGYKEGYEDGFRDGQRTGATRTAVTRAYVAPIYTVPTHTVYTYTVPRIVVRSHRVYRSSCLPRFRTIRCRPHWFHGHRGHRGHCDHRCRCLGSSGLVIRW